CKTEQTMRHEQNHDHQKHSIKYQVQPRCMTSEVQSDFTYGLQRKRPENWAKYAANTTNNRYQQSPDGNVGPVCQSWVDIEKILCVESAGNTCHPAGQHDRVHFDAERVDAQRQGRVFVFTYSDETRTEP